MAVVISTLTACANGPKAKNLEQSLAADPRLKTNSAVFGETQPPTTSTTSQVSLPADFPPEIPKYTNAKLTEIKPVNSEDKKIVTLWQSADSSNVIAAFYRRQFQNDNNLQVLKQPEDNSQGTFEVKGKNLQFQVSIQPKKSPNQPQIATELLIEYTPNNINTTDNNLNKKSDFIGPIAPNNISTQVNSENKKIPSQEFNDLNQVPPEWRKEIEDLGKLGVLSIADNANNNNSPTTNNKFEPDKTITRREYARWLVNANNVMYTNNAAKKIRLASPNTQPAFRDVLSQDPDFPVIQGLAEAGLIPSNLSGNATAVLFRPDAPLTRENLLLWKVPLDTRQALPNANLQAVKQSWGFQDTEKIDPQALRAILADFQNGEKSNIRRVFGYTTIFQPKKAVTRAEAAAAISYFGLQSEGMSTTEALQLKGE